MKDNTSNRQKTAGILAILAYLVCGVLLLAWPQLMTDLTMWALVIVLIGYGLFQLFSYFRMSPAEGAMTFSLAGALLALVLGICILADKSLFAGIIPRIWGLSLLLGGFVKVQESVDALRLKSSHWWWLLIGAAISVVLGIIAITRPTAVLDGVAIYIGVSLIVEAVVDLIMMILVRKQEKQA